MQKIDSFSGEHCFLSNFHPATVELDGEHYDTVEHAYQAAKTTNPFERERIRNMKTPGQAKRAGRHLMLRPDWEDVKVNIMTELVRQKFEYDHLKRRLLETGNAELVEGNTWGDVFWGVCNGIGKNMLGQILMETRQRIRRGGALTFQSSGDYTMIVERYGTVIYDPDDVDFEIPTQDMVELSKKLLENGDKETIANHLFNIANKLSGDEMGHLGAIIHSVVSEMLHGADAFDLIANAHVQISMIKALKGSQT